MAKLGYLIVGLITAFVLVLSVVVREKEFVWDPHVFLDSLTDFSTSGLSIEKQQCKLYIRSRPEGNCSGSRRYLGWTRQIDFSEISRVEVTSLAAHSGVEESFFSFVFKDQIQQRISSVAAEHGLDFSVSASRKFHRSFPDDLALAGVSSYGITEFCDGSARAYFFSDWYIGLVLLDGGRFEEFFRQSINSCGE